ncbi:MAG: S9 family peptidase [Candidatus Margulisiibacteriota bacterium]|jgi:dipeptidyl aminopeptidase/acylaminoacyl peptidase
MKKLIIFISVIFCLGFFANFIDARSLEISDLLQLTKFSVVELAPDESKALYIASGNIWICNLIQAKKTISPINYKLGAGTLAHWAADSKTMVFIKQQEKINQLFLYNFSSDFPEIPTFSCLTNVRQNIEDFEFSPDGQRIAFLMQDQSAEISSNNPKIQVFQEMPELRTRNLWLLDLASKSIQKITSLNAYIINFDWAPDGKKIVISQKPDLSRKAAMLTRLSLVNLETNKITDLMPAVSTANLPYTFPKWTPDNRYIYFYTLNAPKDYWRGSIGIAFYDVVKKQVIEFPEAGERRITKIYGYNPKTKNLYYLVEQGFGYNLFALNFLTGKTQAITTGNSIYENFSIAPSFKKTVFSFEDATHPPALYVSNFPFLKPQKITTFNDYLNDVSLGKTEVINWRAEDRTQIEGLLVKPVNFDPSKKYPLLVVIHGGPANSFSNRFLNCRYSFPPQLYAAKNYLVLLANPRGSTSYSNKFRIALNSNWGEIDYADIMSGVDHLTKKLNIVDINKMGVAGWSYGGYLTGVIITKTNCFKAASIGAGITDLFSLYGTIDIPDWLISYFGNPPFIDPKLFLFASPVYRAERIQTPVLIIHGAKDLRVPASQGKELFRALDFQNKPVQFVIYPFEEHGFKDPDAIRDVIQRNLDWFEKYLR